MPAEHTPHCSGLRSSTQAFYLLESRGWGSSFLFLVERCVVRKAVASGSERQHSRRRGSRVSGTTASSSAPAPGKSPAATVAAVREVIFLEPLPPPHDVTPPPPRLALFPHRLFPGAAVALATAPNSFRFCWWRTGVPLLFLFALLLSLFAFPFPPLCCHPRRAAVPTSLLPSRLPATFCSAAFRASISFLPSLDCFCWECYATLVGGGGDIRWCFKGACLLRSLLLLLVPLPGRRSSLLKNSCLELLRIFSAGFGCTLRCPPSPFIVACLLTRVAFWKQPLVSSSFCS